MFIKSCYKTRCGLKRQPTLISKDELSQYEPHQYLQYPPEKVDDIQPEYYVCKNKEYDKIALQPNVEQAKVPFVPCCFRKRDKEAIVAPKEDREEDVPDYTLTSTGTIKNEGQAGAVQFLLHRYLLQIDSRLFYQRIGVRISPISILDSLETYHSVKHDSPKRSMEFLIDEFLRTLQDHTTEFEIFGSSTTYPHLLQEIVRKRTQFYIDPRLFYRALESMYRVHLLLFVEDKKTLDISLFSPLYLRYLNESKNTDERPVIVLIEYWQRRILRPYPHYNIIAYRSDWSSGHSRLSFSFPRDFFKTNQPFFSQSYLPLL
ncbi:hypothetical protein EBS02_10315, partial [bacterium]|nr:hypothetical protein [bacterium]